MATGYNNDDGDDADQLGRQVLPIANLPENFSGEPEDGMQYLFTVRRNARSLPNTTRVHNPYQLPEAVAPLPSGSSAELDLLPSQEWLQLFETRFRNLRENMQQPTIHVGPPPGAGALLPSSMDRVLWWAFLQGEPQEVWRPAKRSKRQERRQGKQSSQFTERSDREPPRKKARIEISNTSITDISLNGSQSQPIPGLSTQEYEEPEDGEIEEGEVSKQLLVYTEDGEEVEGAGPSQHAGFSNPKPTVEANTITPREVTPNLLVLLDPKQPLQLIRSFTFWIPHQPPLHPRQSTTTERYFPVTDSHARWIFGLLAILETHLTGDEIHILRELARAILGLIRDRLKEYLKIKQGNPVPGQDQSTNAQDPLAPWWANVAIVATVWGQRDLWSDAEDMVRRIQQG